MRPQYANYLRHACAELKLCDSETGASLITISGDVHLESGVTAFFFDDDTVALVAGHVLCGPGFHWPRSMAGELLRRKELIGSAALDHAFDDLCAELVESAREAVESYLPVVGQSHGL